MLNLSGGAASSEVDKFKIVFVSVKNLLTAGAVIAIGFAVIKYQSLITPVHPIPSAIAGTIIVLIGLGLSLWAAFHDLVSLGKAFCARKWYIAGSGLKCNA